MAGVSPAEARLHRRIERLRERVDAIDRRILAAVAARLEVVREIGELKARLGLHSFQRSRWLAMARRWRATGDGLGVDRRFVAGLLELLHEESLRVQRARGRGRKT